MVLIISGHQRSGTTLLRRLCDAHPQMRIANEFGCFADVGLTVGQAVAARLAQWRLVNGRWAFDSRFASHPRRHWHNLGFGLGYGWQLARAAQGKVTVTAVAHALQKQLGQTAVVGDKLPQYTPLLPTLLAHEAVKVLLIYRDGRDVTSSFLEKVRTVWQTRDWASQLNTAEKIALHWVAQMNQMAELKATCLPSQLHIMQYEQLVAEPDTALAALAAWLGVAPGGFPLQQVKISSIGKYRQGLSPAEIAQVEAVAGPKLHQLGYAI